MVFNMEFIDYLHDIEPYVLEVTWEGEWFSGHLQIVDVARVVTRNDFFFQSCFVPKCSN